MLELVGGIISIVVGVIMLIIGGSIINTITVGGSIGDCASQDYNGDDVTGNNAFYKNAAGASIALSGSNRNATNDDTLTQAYIQCNSTKNNGYTILNIISVMMIIGGVITSIRGVQG